MTRSRAHSARESPTGFGAGELHALFPGDTEALIARIAGPEAPRVGARPPGVGLQEESG